MKTEASLLQAIATASTLREQAGLIAELDALRAAKAARAQDDRDIAFSEAVVTQTLTPVLTHSLHTAATDWIEDMAGPEVNHNDIHAEAALWFGKTASFVKEDAEEFTEQARGYAHRYASQFGESRDAAERTFLEYVAFLMKREGASGLPQIQQLIDGNNQPSRTNLPTEVFDNFAPEIDPQNQGVDEAQSSTNAPLLNEIIQAGSGEGQSEQDATHGAGQMTGPASPFPMQSAASLLDAPSVAHGYLFNMDDFRRQAALEAEAKGLPEALEKNKFPKGSDRDGDGETNEGEKDSKEFIEEKEREKKEAASSLPQVQQLTNVHDEYDPQPLNTEVAFPLLPFMKEMTTAPDGDTAKPKSAKRMHAAANPEGVTANPLLGHTLNGEDRKVEEPTNAMAKAVEATRKADFAKGFHFAASWQPGDRLVRQGSAEFEAGLYEGIKGNTAAQQAWLDAHVAQAHLDPFIAKRPQMHMEFTAMRRQAATTTDLEQMTPGAMGGQDGDAPIQGRGKVPPMAGGTDPARAGGAAMYNGAEPFSSPVAPDPGYQDPRARQAAFRARVAQNLPR